MLAMGSDKFFTKPFHTAELVCDPVDALINPQVQQPITTDAVSSSQSSWLWQDQPAHFGDLACADICVLVQRLQDLLSQAIKTNLSFCIFFEAALSSHDLNQLSR